jgi:hypothetical protein
MHDNGDETPEENHDIVEAIASINGQTSPTKVPYRSIILAKESVQEKKFFSFTEANDAKD